MEDWYEIEEFENDETEFEVTVYDITSSPNDFNIKTYYDFVESGVIVIPPFQRNFVWDIARSSKLIESLIIGLPIPQIFLFEEKKNSFLVIDGQQRLLSIYYFIKGRFPRKEKRAELRKILIEKGGIVDDELLSNNTYYRDFKLSLSPQNQLHGKSYETLDEYKTTFDLRALRNILVRQNTPFEDGNSSMYEIFNRLNIGGVNLTAQEIRSSLYHSDFYTMLHKINLNENWREFLNNADLDLHLKDIEILLRAFGLLLNFESAPYKGNMKRFLNEFSAKAKKYTDEQLEKFETLFSEFLSACSELDSDTFYNINKRFHIAVFDAVFVAWGKKHLDSHTQDKIDPIKIKQLKEDSDFKEYTEKSTTNTANIRERIKLAEQYLFES